MDDQLKAAALMTTGAVPVDETRLAAAALLARYSGRTLEAYRHDLRSYFQWALDNRLEVLAATRPHVELHRSVMEQRGLAASTIDRRLSTVCGFYRFAHIDGRIGANPAQYVRRPKVPPTDGRGMDRGELGTVLFTAERFDRDHAALAVLLGLNGLRVSEACATNIEDLGVQRGHRTLRIVGKGNTPATVPLVPRTARTLDLAIGERCEGPILRRRDGQRLDRRTAHRWVRSIGKRAGLGLVHPHMLRAGFIMPALDAGVPLRDVQIAARHADPRTTTIYDHRRENFDRHAAYVVVAYIAGDRTRTQIGTSATGARALALGVSFASMLVATHERRSSSEPLSLMLRRVASLCRSVHASRPGRSQPTRIGHALDCSRRR
jgi:integrase/recombinase XerD